MCPAFREPANGASRRGNIVDTWSRSLLPEPEAVGWDGWPR